MAAPGAPASLPAPAAARATACRTRTSSPSRAAPAAGLPALQPPVEAPRHAPRRAGPPPARSARAASRTPRAGAARAAALSRQAARLSSPRPARVPLRVVHASRLRGRVKKSCGRGPVRSCVSPRTRYPHPALNKHSALHFRALICGGAGLGQARVVKPDRGTWEPPSRHAFPAGPFPAARAPRPTALPGPFPPSPVLSAPPRRRQLRGTSRAPRPASSAPTQGPWADQQPPGPEKLLHRVRGPGGGREHWSGPRGGARPGAGPRAQGRAGGRAEGRAGAGAEACGARADRREWGQVGVPWTERTGVRGREACWAPGTASHLRAWARAQGGASELALTPRAGSAAWKA